MPPDYVSLLQHVLEPPVPTPTAADHARFHSYTVKPGMSRDKTASAACTCLLAGALLYNMQILWRCFHLEDPVVAGKPVSSLIASATAAVCWVLAHVLMELAFMCWVSREPALYKRHRSGCMMVTRTGLLLLMSFYIPKTYDHTLAMEVHAGRAAAATLRLVLGFVAIHVLEVLCFRLPFRLAVPYHTARVAFSLQIMPSTIKVFAAHPAVTAVACNIWEQIGLVYLSAASYILGTPLTPYDAVQSDRTAALLLGGPSANSTTVQVVGQAVQDQSLSASHDLCVGVLLLVFLSLSLGLLVPLYVLYVLEVADFRAFMAAGDRVGSTGSSSASGSVSSTASSSRSLGSILAHSSSSVTSSVFDQQHQQQQHYQSQQAPHTQLPVIDSTVPGADAGNATPAAAVNTAAHGVVQQAGGGGDDGSSSSVMRGGSLLRAAVAVRGSGNPAVLAPASPPAGSGADPAVAAATAAAAAASTTATTAPAAPVNSTGHSSTNRGLSGVWPVHFSAPLHALVLFCLTGWVWAGVNAGWGMWQQRFGVKTCFVPVPT